MSTAANALPDEATHAGYHGKARGLNASEIYEAIDTPVVMQIDMIHRRRRLPSMVSPAAAVDSRKKENIVGGMMCLLKTKRMHGEVREGETGGKVVGVVPTKFHQNYIKIAKVCF